ncbi:hypothetical protein [Bowmanella yangjiangensis]
MRRNERELASPDASWRFEAQDVLGIAGKPRRVERVERYLLKGP